MRLVDKQTSAGPGANERSQWNVEQSNLILESYGLDAFIADIEASRQFWRDGEHVISSILDYTAAAGFSEIWLDTGLNLKTAAQFRELLKFKTSRGIF